MQGFFISFVLITVFKDLTFVCDSIEEPGGSRCVDIFKRLDNTFGFEEFRRDYEDLSGWFPIGTFSSYIFESRDEAIQAACEHVEWFKVEIEIKDK